MKDPQTPDQMRRKVQLLWAHRYGLPPNDERFYRLTLREAIEDVIAWGAVEDFHKNPTQTIDATQPILTGDPEWDRMELEEWQDWSADPAKDL